MDSRPVVDTDILIDYLRGRGPGAGLLDQLGPRGYLVTAISAFELALGSSHGQDRRPVLALLDTSALGLSPAAGLRSGEILAALRAKGTAIDVRDALQAGICVEANRPLVSKNHRHFARIAELRLFGPETWD